jgi:hypothetical protein
VVYTVYDSCQIEGAGLDEEKEGNEKGNTSLSWSRLLCMRG